MKGIFRIPLFLLLATLIFSCKPNQDVAYKKFYSSINKQYNDAESFNYVPAPVEKKKSSSGCCGEKDPEVEGYINTMFKDMDQANKLADELGKKPCLDNPKEVLPSKVAVISPKQNQSTNNSAPAIPKKSISEEPTRSEKVKPVYEKDANALKAYSVVVAAIRVKANAEELKAKLESDGYNVILVQNEQGIYRLILASSDDKEEVVTRKKEVLLNFTSSSSLQDLRSKYHILFDDWWILRRIN